MDTKQVIVMRKDLNMRKGKMIAQGAHASLAVVLKLMDKLDFEAKDIFILDVYRNTPLDDWINGKFTKICLGVNSEEELLTVFSNACKAELPCELIRDSGLTEFQGVPTLTCLAIGPEDAVKIDAITGHLKLL